MKTNTSVDLFNKYFSLNNRQIIVKLKNNQYYKGKFIGYFKDDLDSTENNIAIWHLTEEDTLFGTDSFGFLIGHLINHSDISQVKFLEDNSLMVF
ncbi:MAG: hypothetical protein WCK02_14235 [Bacteroidota bacterium]